jgi:hypothetical protein
LEVLSGKPATAFVALHDTLAALRRQLSRLPQPTVRLRRVMPPEDFLPLQELVRKTYRAAGAPAALLVLRTATLSLDTPVTREEQ